MRRPGVDKAQPSRARARSARRVGQCRLPAPRETLQSGQLRHLRRHQDPIQSQRPRFPRALAQASSRALVRASAREFTNDKATDFAAILTKLKGSKPDVVFFGGMDAVAGPMLRQMKQLGIKAKFLGGDGICTAELAKLAGEAMGDEQVVCAEAGGVTAKQEKGLEDFKARFKQKYNAEVQIYAPYVYDATMAMASAMQKANSADPAKYLPELAKISMTGVTGTIAFDAKGDIKDGTLTLFTYKKGQKEKIAVVR